MFFDANRRELCFSCFLMSYFISFKNSWHSPVRVWYHLFKLHHFCHTSVGSLPLGNNGHHYASTSTAQHIDYFIWQDQILPNPHNTAQFNYAHPATAQFNHACPATAQFKLCMPCYSTVQPCMPCYSTVQLTYITFFFMSATLISFRRNSLMASRSLTS